MKSFHLIFQNSPRNCFSVSDRFLHNMNIETRVGALGQGLEVGVDGVLGSGAEGVPDHPTEVVQSVRVVGESDNRSL